MFHGVAGHAGTSGRSRQIAVAELRNSNNNPAQGNEAERGRACSALKEIEF
jgi:hypothetical protein